MASATPLEPLELRKEVIRELERPGLVKHLGRIHVEKLRRPVAYRRPGIVVWENLDDDPKEFSLKPPEGSVTLYWTPRRSSLIRRLEAAFCKRDIDLLDQIYKPMLSEYKSRSVISIEESADNLLGSNSTFDFLYDDTLLAGNLYLHDAECGSITLPYNGGHFDKEQFRIREFAKEAESSHYDTLVVISMPRLTDIERAAINAVPAAQASSNFTSAALCFSVCALVTIAVFVTINTAATTCCGSFHERLAGVRLPEDTLERLGGITSARQLLAMREEVFSDFGIL